LFNIYSMKHLLDKETLNNLLESFVVQTNSIIWIHHPITEDLIQVKVVKSQKDKILVSILENSPYIGQPDWWMKKINVIGIFN
jgi:hypothetical protein